MATPLQRLEEELSCRPDRVMIVAGIGVSVASCGGHPCASWKGLLMHGLLRCEESCGTGRALLDNYRAILSDTASPTHALIGVGQFVTDELTHTRTGLFGQWLSDSIGGLQGMDLSLVKALASLGAKLATTNYDGMIECGTGSLPITWQDRAQVASFFREQTRDVLHLHGDYRRPKSVILGARSYGEICNDEFAQNALRGLMIHGTLLFVGCGAGLEDPNFGTLLEWATATLAECHHGHFILVRSSEVETWRARLRGVPIEPVPYGAEHGELATFLQGLAGRLRKSDDRQPLSQLATSQGDFDTSWEELERGRERLTPIDYFRQSRALAAELWRAGGKRRAAMAFSNRVTFRAQPLLAPEYVEFALDAAEWLLDDDLPTLASHHLDETRGRIPGADIPPEHLARFRLLWVRCLDDLCAYTEVLRAIDEAYTHADYDGRQRLEAERAEIHFLQGNFDRAVADPE